MCKGGSFEKLCTSNPRLERLYVDAHAYDSDTPTLIPRPESQAPLLTSLRSLPCLPDSSYVAKVKK